MGLGTDIDTGLPMGLSPNVYAKYQWQKLRRPMKTNGRLPFQSEILRPHHRSGGAVTGLYRFYQP